MTDTTDSGTDPEKPIEEPAAEEKPKTSTPVPPRGQKRKPSRPSSGRPTPKAGQRPGGGAKAGGTPAGGATKTSGGTRGGGARPAGGGTAGKGQRAGVNRRQAEWQARRRRNLTLALVAVAVVVVVVGVLIGVKVAGGGGSKNSSTLPPSNGSSSNLTPAEAGVSGLPASAAKVKAVPVATLAAASKGVTIDKLTGGKAITNQPPLTTNGKPTVLYIGAGFCPYCAAERWSLVAALSKFGTFQNLGSTASSGTDTNPNTPTFSFYKSSFSSPYINFTSVETTTQNENQALETPTAAENALWKKLDSSQTIPFINFGNKYLITGATYDSSSMSNQSFDTVAAEVANNSTTAGKGINQAAGAMVKAICKMTNNQPANVCSAIGS